MERDRQARLKMDGAKDLMAPAPVIDIAALLKPIAGDNPCGIDVRDKKSFEILKEARREEDALSQGDWKREAKVADWAKVVQTATGILTTESKDLQVAVWLLEGLIRCHGFPGLREGLKLVRELHEQYWESFYPLIEGGDLEYRSGRIDTLNKVLPFAIKNVPLTHPPGGPLYAYAHYKESQDVENLRRGAAADADKRRHLEEALAEGKLEGDKFEKAVAGTPLTHCSALLDVLTQTVADCEQLDGVLEEQYGQDAPSVRLIQEAVGECRSLMDTIVRKKGGTGVQQTVLQTSNSEPVVVRSVPEWLPTGGIEPFDREDALRRLTAIAEFFSRTEPHSPVSYLVQRAAKWGAMPLGEWLREVIKNPDVLGEVRETLGMKEPDRTDES